MRVYYFGVAEVGGAGHYLYQSAGEGRVVVKTYREQEQELPFRMTILDSGLLPPGSADKEFLIRRACISGWTVLSFWDRTGDSRPGSNSAFVFEGDVTTGEGVEAAGKEFPTQFKRFGNKLQMA